MLNEYLNTYLSTLKKSDKKMMFDALQSVEKQIPPEYQDSYILSTKNILYIFAIGLSADDKTALQISTLLVQRNIPVNIWARYMSTAIWFGPLVLAHKKNNTKLKNVTINAIANFNKEVDLLKQKTSVVREQQVFIFEGVIRNIFNKIGNSLKTGALNISKAVGMFLLTTVDIYNQLFSLVTHPVRKVLERIPGGSYLLRFGLNKYVLCNLSPIGSILVGVHTTISNPMVRQGATLAKQMISGTFWTSLDKIIGDLTKDINMDDFEDEVRRNKEGNNKIEENEDDDGLN